MPEKIDDSSKKTGTGQDAGTVKKGGSQNQQENNLEKNLLTFEDGLITLSGDELPGILEDLQVRGAVRFDKAQKDGMSGSKKTPMGFEDSNIVIALCLLSDDESDCYAKLAIINGKFKGLDNRAAPQVYSVFNRHLEALGIEKIIFSKLDSHENDKEDSISVTLGFEEHNPPVIRRESQVIQAKSEEAKAAANAKPDPEKLAAELEEKVENDLSKE